MALDLKEEVTVSSLQLIDKIFLGLLSQKDIPAELTKLAAIAKGMD